MIEPDPMHASTNPIDVHDATNGTDARKLTAEQRATLAALLARDPEGWCRLQGLLAMLALPPLSTGRRPEIQVQIGETWHRIDRVYVTPAAIIVAQGVNGHTASWEFPQPGLVPEWQPTERYIRHGLPGDDGAR